MQVISAPFRFSCKTSFIYCFRMRQKRVTPTKVCHDNLMSKDVGMTVEGKCEVKFVSNYNGFS
jgi:hypothetical protein